MSDSIRHVDAPTLKRMVPRNSTLDKISNLPCDVLDNILIRLPIQEAARTAILSKKWSFKWLSIPQLVFDSDYFLWRRSFESLTQLWSQIYQILLLHRGPLQKFVLIVHYYEETESCLINQIIDFLAGKDIQELTLSLPPFANRRVEHHTIPSTLFQYSLITHLNLTLCVFKLPPEFIGFSKLISVEFHLLRIASDDFKLFMAKSPRLQQLVLDVYCDHPIEIDAPNLKLLHFVSYRMPLVLKNVPVLSTVTINSSVRFEGQNFDVVKLFDSLPAVEYLVIGRDLLMCLSVGVIPQMLPSMLKHLKSVEVSLSYGSLKEIQCAVLLIRSSPNLQKLKIEACHYSVDGQHTILQFFEALSLVKDSFNQLQEVTMDDLVATEHEMGLIKFILARSFVLKKIFIQPHNMSWLNRGISTERRLEILKAAITRFQKASTEVEIIYS